MHTPSRDGPLQLQHYDNLTHTTQKLLAVNCKHMYISLA